MRTEINPSIYAQGIQFRSTNGINIDPFWSNSGVTEQFLEHADTYHERYFDDAHWSYLLGRGLELAERAKGKNLNILDIGSGSGNTAIPLAKKFLNSKIIAVDISPNLLVRLIAVARSIGLSNISAHCFDLHKDIFRPATFDFCVGAAVLHHMLDPAAALKNVAKWLKPSAVIILYEPMEIGAHIMCAVYQTLHDELLGIADPRLLTFFEAMIVDYQARFGVPRIKPWTSSLDDKWMFHASYLHEVCGQLGLRLVGIHDTGAADEPRFTNDVRGTLNVAGLGNVPTPKKMWDLLAEFDNGLAPNLKRRFASTGIIIIKK
jgi:2-polyprenyl-3-methyl-5-hydroxy-6-metoxy-1,4-benzoquinol methylase